MMHYTNLISEKIIKFTLNFISFISIPINIITYFAIERSQCFLIKIAPILFACVVLVVFFFKKQISTKLKSILLITIFFFVGIYTLLLGLLDMASLWFILSIIFSFFTYSKKLPVVIFFSAFILTLITGLLMISKNPYFQIDYGFQNCQFACVSIRIINFLIIGFLIFKILKIFFTTIDLYIYEVTEKNLVLEQLKTVERNEAEGKLRNQILKNNIEKHELEIKYKQKELSDAVSKILQFNALLKKIKTNISGGDNKLAVMHINSNLSGIYNIDTFILKLNEVYPGFSAKLVDFYPELTKTEVKVCILISSRLKSAEIAELLNVNETTIAKYRHRIRKKIDLNSDADIAQYFSEKFNFQ